MTQAVLSVNIGIKETCISSYHSGERYGDWEEHNNPSLSEPKIVERGEFSIPAGTKKIYVFWVQYGDGDTFGHSYGNGRVIDIFQTSEEAEAIMEAYKEHINKGSHDNFVFNGKDYGWIPGMSYFELIEDFHIELKFL